MKNDPPKNLLSIFYWQFIFSGYYLITHLNYFYYNFVGSIGGKNS